MLRMVFVTGVLEVVILYVQRMNIDSQVQKQPDFFNEICNLKLKVVSQ